MIVGIILAAGASSRMGRPKALLPIGGETFVSRVCRTLTAAGAEDVLVVAGEEIEAVTAALHRAGLSARVIENRRRREGQLSSVLAGLAVADRPGVEAVIIHLVDAPLVTAGTVRAVMEAFRRTRAPVVRPVVNGRHGHPVLFARTVFDELRRADLSVGVSAVVRAHAADAYDVPVEDEGACRDIDTPEDYARLVGDEPRG
jgi:molybdenum cofactor cytidylyltransferase